MTSYTVETQIGSSETTPGAYDVRMKLRMALSNYNTVQEIRQGVVDAVLNQAREQGWPVMNMPFHLTGARCKAQTVGDDIIDVEGTFLPTKDTQDAKERDHALRTLLRNRTKMERPRAPWNF